METTCRFNVNSAIEYQSCNSKLKSQLDLKFASLFGGEEGLERLTDGGGALEPPRQRIWQRRGCRRLSGSIRLSRRFLADRERDAQIPVLRADFFGGHDEGEAWLVFCVQRQLFFPLTGVIELKRLLSRTILVSEDHSFSAELVVLVG